jgi:hypothetical protein
MSWSDYNPLNILKQAPTAIKTFVLLILTALVVRGTIHASDEEIAIWGLIIERGLELMYVAPAKEAKLKADLTELSG